MDKMSERKWETQASSYGMNKPLKDKPQDTELVNDTVKALYGDTVATLMVSMA